MSKLTPEILLRAYASGVFPMAEARNDPDVFWVDPHLRGILPLDGLHISKSLARTIRRESFQITADRRFLDVVRGCADRQETWINDTIFELYGALHGEGFAHSIEVWAGDRLAGGVYGVALGAAFFGESMFSRERDASKVALAFLVDRLVVGGFTLFDTQFVTPHLKSLGATEISRRQYQRQLAAALEKDADFHKQPKIPTGHDVVQRNTQTSYRG